MKSISKYLPFVSGRHEEYNLKTQKLEKKNNLKKVIKKISSSIKNRKKKSTSTLTSYKIIHCSNLKNKALSEIHIKALTAKSFDEMKTLPADFCKRLEDEYPNIPNEEEKKNIYNAFTDIIAHYSFMCDAKKQKDLGINDNPLKKKGNVYDIFKLVYSQTTSSRVLKKKINDDAFRMPLFRAFIPIDKTNPKVKFIHEDCLSIKAYENIAGAISRLEEEKAKVKDLLQEKSKDSNLNNDTALQLIIDAFDDEIQRLTPLSNQDRSKLKTDKQVMQDIFNKQLEINNFEINKKITCYIRDFKSIDNSKLTEEEIIDGIMEFSTSLINHYTTAKEAEELETFREILTDYVYQAFETSSS